MPPALALVCDFLEEKWPSMDLVGEMLFHHLTTQHSDEIVVTRMCPSLRRRFGRIPLLGSGHLAWNMDRFINRFWDYPRWLLFRRGQFNLFHIVDHSYSQLVHALPAGRTVVTCHDLDTFQSLLEPDRQYRSRVFRAMTKRILDGFVQAAHVICVSETMRQKLLGQGLVAPQRVSVVPNGVHPSCTPDPDPAADAEASRLLRPTAGHNLYLLHVGSTTPRKRIDLLLRVFALIRKEFPEVRLVRVGGPFREAQFRLVRELALDDAILVLPFLERNVLAGIYRRATLLLQPSEAEGFGLPVIEAMACGCPVLVSDLPVLREVGGQTAAYCPVGDIHAWSETAIELLYERMTSLDCWRRRRSAGLAHARQFTWAKSASKTVEVYLKILRS